MKAFAKRIWFLAALLVMATLPLRPASAQASFTGVVTYRSGKNAYLQSGTTGILAHLDSSNDPELMDGVKRGKVVTVTGAQIPFNQGGYVIPEITDAMIVSISDGGASAATVSASLGALGNELMAVRVRVEGTKGDLAAKLQISPDKLAEYSEDQVLVATGVLSANTSGMILLGAGVQPKATPAPTEAPTPEPTSVPTDTPEPTAPPTGTPEPTAPPTDTPALTAPPTNTPAPTAAPAGAGDGAGAGYGAGTGQGEGTGVQGTGPGADGSGTGSGEGEEPGTAVSGGIGSTGDGTSTAAQEPGHETAAGGADTAPSSPVTAQATAQATAKPSPEATAATASITPKATTAATAGSTPKTTAQATAEVTAIATPAPTVIATASVTAAPTAKATKRATQRPTQTSTPTAAPTVSPTPKAAEPTRQKETAPPTATEESFAAPTPIDLMPQTASPQPASTPEKPEPTPTVREAPQIEVQVLASFTPEPTASPAATEASSPAPEEGQERDIAPFAGLLFLGGMGSMVLGCGYVLFRQIVKKKQPR